MAQKFLVTSGCSFSECITPWLSTWPKQLAKYMPEREHISCGLGSQGNGLISRRLIYNVSKLLSEQVDPKDIFVGVMWSGPDRHDFYLDSEITLEFDQCWMENPTGFVNDDKRWVILNSYWTDLSLGSLYYKNFHSSTGSMVYTIEHILRVQWFLDLHKIPYFMSTYTSEVFNPTLIKHPEVDFLYKQINFDKFLPVTGEYEWVRDNSKFDFIQPGDCHPSSEQHLEFVDNIILPFIKEKYNV